MDYIENMDYRNEWKHEISYSDMLVLRQRLRAVMKSDLYTNPDGTYHIRSLYFDTPTDKVLREKIDGVNAREKFRIRYYNGDTNFIKLEKKSKLNGLGNKQSAIMADDEIQALLDGEIDWMPLCTDRPLLIELYSKMMSENLRPKTIVDYIREPFIYAPGNVRVTLDSNIRTSMRPADFFNPDCITIPAGEPVIILEVKWDQFLPSMIRSAVQLSGRRSTAFSKYQICRIYG